jgi:hypothetical protein
MALRVDADPIVFIQATVLKVLPNRPSIAAERRWDIEREVERLREKGTTPARGLLAEALVAVSRLPDGHPSMPEMLTVLKYANDAVQKEPAPVKLAYRGGGLRDERGKL